MLLQENDTGENTVKTICLIIPYFGKEPDYFHLFMLSAGANKTIDFFFLTDQNIESSFENVKMIQTSFQSIQEKAKHILGKDIVLTEPYKLCDYKPTYGILFQDMIQSYDFWGYCDVDLILGDLRKWLTEERLTQFDKLYYSGHLTLYRNCHELNNLFYRIQKGYADYRTAFHTKYPCHFDEGSIVAHSEILGIPTYKNSNDFSDVSPRFYSFVWGAKAMQGSCGIKGRCIK